MISTDGDQSTITYEIQEKNRNAYSSTYQASLLPIQLGQIRKIRLSNTLAESGKTIFIDMFKAPASMLAAIAQGSLISGGTTISGRVEITKIAATTKAQNTNWLATDISPVNPPCVHRLFIRVEPSTQAGVQVYLHKDDSSLAATDEIFYINDKVALKDETGYVFDVPLQSNESYNIQHDTDTAEVTITITEYSNFTG